MCDIRKENHDQVNCGWIQVVDTATLLSATEQEQLCGVCPYLKEPIEPCTGHFGVGLCGFT